MAWKMIGDPAEVGAETVITLARGGMRATITARGDVTMVDFTHAESEMYGLAEAARLLAHCADTVGDLESQDGEPLGLTVDVTDLMDARLRFFESAERIMLVVFFGEELEPHLRGPL